MMPKCASRTILVLAIGGLFAGLSSSRAESIPVWNPAELTRQSDLIVVGELIDNRQIQITEVLKGQVPGQEVSVPSIGGFVNESRWPWSENKITLGAEAIVFLSRRGPKLHVVANGIYRAGEIDAQRGVLGYWQEMNPGGYVLKPEIQFATLAAVKALVEIEIKAIPNRQQALLEEIAAANSRSDFYQTLHNLELITRTGDVEVLNKVAQFGIAQPMYSGHIARFIATVGDPAGTEIIQSLYEKSGEVAILYSLGKQGDPKSLAYFESLIEKKRVPEPAPALRGMSALYLAMEAKGDQKNCELIRDAIYRLVDQNSMEAILLAPEVISVIPDQRSLDRLKRVYDYYASKQGGMVSELPRHIARCEEKIRTIKDATAGDDMP